MKVNRRHQKQFLAIRTVIASCMGLMLITVKSPAKEGLLIPNLNFRQELSAKGIDPCVILSTEGWGNVNGGLRTGGWYDHLLDFGLRLNTSRLGWWEDGNFLVQGHWAEQAGNGECFGEQTGAFNPASGIMAGDHIRVFNLYYRHVWSQDKVTLKVGQIAIDDDFMLSDYTGLFLNSAFGAMPSQVGTPLATSCGNGPAFPIYSVAAPGAFLKTCLTEKFSSQLGLYYGNPGPDKTDNYGFDWATQSPAELGLFWENGIGYNLSQHPGAFRFGLSYHTGDLDDFKALNNGNASIGKQSIPNYYIVNDFILLADKTGKTKLGLFFRGGIASELDLSTVGCYADAGFNWFGPLRIRPDDTAGVAISYTKFSAAFQNSSGPDGFGADETTIEITYKAQVTSWMTIQGDTQVLFNPEVTPNSNQRQTTTIIGLRLTFTL